MNLMSACRCMPTQSGCPACIRRRSRAAAYCSSTERHPQQLGQRGCLSARRAPCSSPCDRACFDQMAERVTPALGECTECLGGGRPTWPSCTDRLLNRRPWRSSRRSYAWQPRLPLGKLPAGDRPCLCGRCPPANAKTDGALRSESQAGSGVAGQRRGLSPELATDGCVNARQAIVVRAPRRNLRARALRTVWMLSGRMMTVTG